MAEAQFHWQPQPEAQALVREVVDHLLSHCPRAAELARRMRQETATRFIDWIDSIEVPASDDWEYRLGKVGFACRELVGSTRVLTHEGGVFPTFAVSDTTVHRVFIKVESVADFMAAWMISNDHVIEGEPFAAVRRAPVFHGDGADLWAIERHGSRSIVVPPPQPQRSLQMVRHYESLRRREREWPNDDQGFARVRLLVDAAIADLGADMACDIFFAAEREYWARRNRAARIQKGRQDALGLGWANHDHHTFRSSRQHFRKLVALFERLGMKPRERFYAGAEAGWGAQVLEQPACGIVVFADVDLSPEEVAGDFAHEPLPERHELGTVGLWCGLHGESILQAGMHHLECQFDHEALCDQLQAAGVNTMSPFTDLPYLRQAFSEGERWKVSDARINRLLQAGQITPTQANQFRMTGAIGSHLENLERNDGYKGFNQQGVSDIIARTDPRREAPQAELLGA
ncbi:MAG: hypothetical protein IT430_00715 [Phycisphaerales bacterium]|nr:hypothetical protein [Phycisphaerales bacterium]